METDVAPKVPDAAVEDEARVRKARRRAAWGLVASGGVLASLSVSDDLSYIMSMGVLLIPWTLLSYRELRRPAHLLQASPEEVVARTLAGEGPMALPEPESRPERADRLLRLQEDLDRLEPQGVIGRMFSTALRWSLMVMGLLCTVVLILGGVKAESAYLVTLGTALGAMSGGVGISVLRRENRRCRAREILEDKITELRDEPDLSIPA